MDDDGRQWRSEEGRSGRCMVIEFSDLSVSTTTVHEEERTTEPTDRPTDRPLDEIEEVDRAVGNWNEVI